MCVRTDKALGTVGVVVILAAQHPGRDVSRKRRVTRARFSDLSQVFSQRGSPSSPALGC